MSLDNPSCMDLLCFDGFTKPFLHMFFKVIGFLSFAVEQGFEGVNEETIGG